MAGSQAALAARNRVGKSTISRGWPASGGACLSRAHALGRRLGRVGRGADHACGHFGLTTLGVWQAVTIALTLSASLLFGGRLSDVLALNAPVAGAFVYLSAILAMVVLQLIVSIVQYFLVSGDMFADLRPFVDVAVSPNWGLALLVVGLGAPLSEELLFRGFLLSALAKTRLGFAGAALVSTTLWTALHAGYSLIGILEVFTIGLFFSWMLWRTGSLRVPIFCHALYNSLIVCMLRFVALPGGAIG